MKKFILFAFLHLFTFTLITAQTTLLTEDFETDGEGSRYNSSTFSDCVNSDYFLRTNDNGPFSSCGSFGSVLSNVQGSWFWVCEDIESTANPNGTFSTLTINPLDISGYSSITVSLYMATGRTGTQWEYNDSIKIQASWDGGSYATIGQFVGDGEFGGYLRQDTNLDGLADGGAPDITSTFTNFTFNVPGIGTNLSVRVRMCGLDASEEFAFDKIVVQGSSTPPSNYAPILANIETTPIVFTEGDPAATVTGSITVSDSDDSNLDSAIVQICSGFNASEDVLTYTSAGGISGTFNSTTGILKLTGNTSVANYQTVLHSVKYQNTNTGNPSNIQREICFKVNDGTDDSNTQSRLINIVDVINEATCIPFSESFETDGEGVTYVSNTFNDDPSPNFFFRTNTQPSGHAEAVTGIDGSYFWASEDIMGGSNGSVPGTIEFAPLTITGNSSFTFNVLMGTSNNDGTRWEQTDNILLQYNIDGGGWTTFGLFQGDDPYGGNLRVDTDNDTITAGPYGATVPNASVSDFSFSFSGSGDVMKIRMVFVQQGGSEELVFDDIRISGDVPVAANCKDISVYLDNSGYAAILPEDVMVGSPGDCGIDSVDVTPFEFNCDSVGENTVVLTVFDKVGNSSTCNALVAVQDTIKPEAVCKDITVYLDSAGEAKVTSADVDGGSSDNCDISFSVSDTIFYCSDIGTAQVMLSVEDMSGNISTCTSTVTISDTVSLVIECPGDQTGTIDENCQFVIPDYRSLAVVTNSCGVDTVFQTPEPGSIVGVGDTLITLTAEAGIKTSSCSFNLNVAGILADFTSDVTSGCTMTEVSFSDLSVDAIHWWWDFGDGSPIDTTQNPSHIYIQPGTYSVSLKVSNLNGCTDSTSKVSYVTINPPLAVFDANPTTGCTVPHTVFFTDQSILPDTWFWDFGDGNTSTAQNPIHSYTAFGTFEVTLLVTDTITGCQDTARITISVGDNTPPVINCPADTSAYSDNNCQGELGDYTSLADVFDNCDPSPVVTQLPSPGTLFNDSVKVTLIATDNQNNKDSCSFMVVTIDTIAPVISCNPIEVFLHESGEYVLNDKDIASMIGSISDNCTSSKDLVFSASPRSFECIHVGTAVPVKVTATDINGNETSCWTTVTVYDTIAPIAVCQDITVLLDENGQAVVFPGQVNAGNGMVPVPEWARTYNNIFDGSYDACGIDKIALDRQQFNCGDIGMNLITLTVTDPSGNASTCTAHVKVEDNKVPVVEPVADIEAEVAPGVCETAVDYPEVMVTDNCETTAELTTGLGSDGMFPLGTTTETWTVTDEGGNTATVSFNVTVTTTNAAPTIDSVANITVDEDTALVMVLLTGISYGIDCASQDVDVTATTNNPDLITSIMVNYIDGPTGSVELSVAPDMSGTAEIMLLVTDSEGGEVADTFMVTVQPVNDPPYVVHPVADQVINASYELKIPVSPVLGDLFDDVDDTTLTITAMVEGTDTLPAWATFADDTLTVMPMPADTGCVNIVLMATDAAGATAADTFEVCVEGYPVNIKDMGAGRFEVTMYPNPTRGEVNLDFGKKGIYDIGLSVMDITGRVVLQKQFSVQQTIRFNMSDKVSGMYFVHLDLDGIQVIKKLIVNRK